MGSRLNNSSVYNVVVVSDGYQTQESLCLALLYVANIYMWFHIRLDHEIICSMNISKPRTLV